MTASDHEFLGLDRPARVPFYIHSTFRQKHKPGEQLLPRGLQWGLPGTSFMTYVPSPLTNILDDDAVKTNEASLSTFAVEDTPEVRRGIVEAYNEWCFGKDKLFKTVDDIESLVFVEGSSENQQLHVLVNWRVDVPKPKMSEHYRYMNIFKLLLDDEAATGHGPPAEVWINGKYITTLGNSNDDDDEKKNHNLEVAKAALHDIVNNSAHGLCVRRQDNGFIRIERFLRGYLRNKEQVWDHIVDNLIVMEDVEDVEDFSSSFKATRTLIGTATLPDWIMGGRLTSRIWIQEQDNGNILFLRPLRDDDINTSDRRYELIKGKEDAKIAVVKDHLDRLEFLAGLEHPTPLDTEDENKDDTDGKKKGAADRMVEIREKLRLNRNASRVLGL